MNTATPLAERNTALAPYLDRFETLRAESDPAFVTALRAAGISRFAEVGFPSTTNEEWRFTNLAAIAREPFDSPRTGPVDRDAVLAHAFDAGHRIVFVDGRFAPELSQLTELPAGVVVDSLAAVLAREPGRLEPFLGRHAAIGDHPFVALNSAFFTDGVFVEIPRGTVVETPIQLLYVTTRAAGARALLALRNVIVARENSQSIIVETYAGAGGAGYLNCLVTEVALEANAHVDHSKIQKDAVDAFHLATSQFYQARSSNLFSHSISTGGAFVRNDVNAVLDGEGADCTLNGLYVLRGSQFLDNHMRVDHAKAHCSSFELFKGVLDERSRAVFNGRIFVAKGAQKTDAKQSSRNLLLSREALVNANPQLEIFADDVKCTHGSTVGQLDEDAIFYLRSRGIGEEAARSLLTYAFASDIVERIRVEPVRRELTEFLFSRLPKGEIVRQAV